MAKVPTYNRQLVQEKNIPNARLNAEPQFAEMARGDARIANQALGVMQTGLDIYAQEKRKADDAKVRENVYSAVDALNKLQSDPNDGYLNEKGKYAIERLPNYEEAALENVRKIEEGLTNEYQKKVFKEQMQSHILGYRLSLQRHASREKIMYDNETTENGLRVLQEDSLLNAYDENRVRVNLETQRKELESYADRNGLTKEEAYLRTLDTFSKTHIGVINKMVSADNPMAAKEYFDKYRNEMNAATTDAAVKLLDRSSKDVIASKMSDSIFNSTTSMTDALKETNNIEDVALRDNVKARLKGLFADKKRAELFDQENKFEQIGDILTKSGGDIDSIPKSALANLSLSQENNLRKYALQLKSGNLPEKNSNAYYDLQQMAGSKDTRGLFLRTNLMDPKYKASIHPQQLTELIKLQRDLRGGKGEATKVLDGIETKTSIVNNALKTMEIRTDARADVEDLKRATAFRREIDRKVTDFQDRNGRKISNEELRGIVDDLTVEVSVPNTGIFGFFKTKKRMFEVDVNEEANISFESIPSDDVRKIKEALGKRNIEPTDKAVLDLYLKKLNRN